MLTQLWELAKGAWNVITSIASVALIGFALYYAFKGDFPQATFDLLLAVCTRFSDCIAA